MASADIIDDLSTVYPCYNAINPGMCNYDSRLATFRTWFYAITLPHPEEFAAAGFFIWGKVIGCDVGIVMAVYRTGKLKTIHGLNTLNGFHYVNLSYKRRVSISFAKPHCVFKTYGAPKYEIHL